MTAKKPDTHGSNGMKGTGWKQEIIDKVMNLTGESTLGKIYHTLNLAEEHLKQENEQLRKAIKQSSWVQKHRLRKKNKHVALSEGFKDRINKLKAENKRLEAEGVGIEAACRMAREKERQAMAARVEEMKDKHIDSLKGSIMDSHRKFWDKAPNGSWKCDQEHFESCNFCWGIINKLNAYCEIQEEIRIQGH
jgi:hypothetical protein